MPFSLTCLDGDPYLAVEAKLLRYYPESFLNKHGVTVLMLLYYDIINEEKYKEALQAQQKEFEAPFLWQVS